MAQIMSAEDFRYPAGQFADIAGRRPVTVGDFAGLAAHARLQRRHPAPPASDQQSQVDQLISDLMDIIVRAAGASPSPGTVDMATAEEVALSMMQALLQTDMRSLI